MEWVNYLFLLNSEETYHSWWVELRWAGCWELVDLTHLWGTWSVIPKANNCSLFTCFIKWIVPLPYESKCQSEILQGATLPFHWIINLKISSRKKGRISLICIEYGRILSSPTNIVWKDQEQRINILNNWDLRFYHRKTISTIHWCDILNIYVWSPNWRKDNYKITFTQSLLLIHDTSDVAGVEHSHMHHQSFVELRSQSNRGCDLKSKLLLSAGTSSKV